MTVNETLTLPIVNQNIIAIQQNGHKVVFLSEPEVNEGQTVEWLNLT